MDNSNNTSDANEDYRIGTSMATIDKNNMLVGIAKFTCHKWGDHGLRVVENFTVEVRVRFDPSQSKWIVDDNGLTEYKGRF